VRFHDSGGAGYAFLADRVLEIDAMNPQVASRLLRQMSRWQRYDEQRRVLMREQLQRILDTEDVSKDVFEIVSKSLRVERA